MVKFGGPDTVSIRLLASFENGLFISPYLDSSDLKLQQFLIDNYFTDGAALFGRESRDDLQAFRKAARISSFVNDDLIYEMIQYFVQRVRNYGHLETLFEAEIEEAIVLIEDTNPRCTKYRNKRIFVDGCKMNLDWFRTLSHDDYMNDVFGKDWGFPPFHMLCRCRLEGVIEGIDYSSG